MGIRRALFTAVFAATVALVAPGSDALAQLKGHYIPGFTGLGNGTQPPPSISLGLPIYIYPTDTIKNDDGDTIGGNPSITASFIGLGMMWVTNTTIFGGNLGVQITPLTFLKSRIETNSLDVPGSFAFSDIYVQPLQLGWHKPRADYTIGWGFFAPTGKWEAGGQDNSGLGMWSNDFQAGATVNLDDKHAWSTALLATYEIHSQKEDSDLKPGDILTLEGGTGRAFYQPVEGTPIPRILNVGAVYYAQFKVTADEGPGPGNVLANNKDRVFAAGVEGNIFLPKQKLLLGLRLMPEFEARNRTQGFTSLITVGWQVKSLTKPEHP